MSGTPTGGLLAAHKNKLNFGEDFYNRIGGIGGIGGKNGHTGGFAADPELASYAGRIGGLRSRRGDNRRPIDRKAVERAYVKLMKIHTVARQEKMREALDAES